MKKNLVVLLVFTLIMATMIGCTKKVAPISPAEDNLQENVEESKFKEENGVLTYLDTDNGPFEGVGLKVLIQKGEDGNAKFIKTDLTGTEGADYYIFDYSNNTFEKYYFVSAMGTGYYYYYDLEKDELTKMEDKDHNDTTQSTKDAKRWDSAVEKVKEEIEVLEEYFKEEHNKTIKEFVSGK